ncbi:MAG: hypothetical protein WB996_01550, partial [Ignavibacteriaceae bacterium]
LAELIQFEGEINQLAANNASNRDLLDKSLYPDNFNSSIENLRKELEVRKGDFTQISELETKVSVLNMQLSDLNDRNVELMAQVRNLTEQSKSDKNKLDLLQRSIASLRSSLRRRDDLVISMIDSLMPADFRNSGTLSNQEKQKIYSKAQKGNIIENLQNAIDENIMFLKVTALKPGDIKSIKDKKQQFEKTWHSFGPKLIEIYSEKGKKVKNAKEIDSTFEKWNLAIGQEAWSSMSQEFSDFDIKLNDYSNGMEFTRAMISYTQDEIKNIKTKADSAVKDYIVFADSAWYGNIKPIWVPYLIDNNLLTSAQKDKIESGILKWKEAVYPVDYSWLYIVGSLLISIIIIVLIRRNYKKKNESLNSDDGVKE